ncbi:ATP-binding protein [Leisingera caerulea]|uniref:ATP-binding protein n=1 Tax=Leisingera caerulea TaxID=506591 RepID=A0A9Q9M1Z3_LEICA|nr:ATP-binding protein [Leisingera caerulea]UWQ53033.1 ATP-binding protein [Leisingera caerulea]
MNLSQLLKASHSCDLVFVGPNGAGKSRTLRDLCTASIQSGKRVIAISNTQYSRFPDFQRENYNHVRVNPSMTNDILKTLIIDTLDSKSRSYSSMREVLSYTGYSPTLHVRINIGQLNLIGPHLIKNILDEVADVEGVNDEVRNVLENIHRIGGEHKFDLEDIYSFFSGRELVAALLKYQSTINRVLRPLKTRVMVSFALTRQDGLRVPVHKASSGELTLISLSMFVLSNSDKLDHIFIDEPENSLHPQWQSKFLDFLSSIARRDNIKFLLASHSPVLLTGALATERDVKVFRCRPNGVAELTHFRKESDDSVEELLWEAFDVITPASRFVAKRISDLLWHIEDGLISRSEAIRTVESFIEKSISNDQRAFLKASIRLLEDTAEVGSGTVG